MGGEINSVKKFLVLPSGFQPAFKSAQGWGFDNRAKLTQVQVPGVARDFSPKVNFQCRLSNSVRTCSPRVQSRASTSVRTLKIPSSGSHTIVWTHKNTSHNDRNG